VTGAFPTPIPFPASYPAPQPSPIYTIPALVNTPAPAPTGPTGAVWVEPYEFTHGVQADPSNSPIPVKTAAGTLGGVGVYNNTGVTQCIQVFDKLAGSVTLGSTHADKTMCCTTVTQCFLPIPTGGTAMTTGITLYCTTTPRGATGCASGVDLFWDFRYRDSPCIQPPSFHLRPRPFTLAPRGC
jgi:hypothetical protein